MGEFENLVCLRYFGGGIPWFDAKHVVRHGLDHNAKRAARHDEAAEYASEKDDETANLKHATRP